MAPNLEAKVQELWDREQIRQCLLRYCRGSTALIATSSCRRSIPIAWTNMASSSAIRKSSPTGRSASTVAAHQSHQHCLLNQTVEFDGDTAHAETYFMFDLHEPKGKPLTLGGGRYVDRLEKRNGEWRIAARVTLRDWAMMDEIADMSDLTSFTSTRALLSEIEKAFMNAGRGPARDRSDPSYDRPLTVDPARREAYLKMQRGGERRRGKEVKSMKAVTFHEFGGPEKLRIEDHPVPTTGAGRSRRPGRGRIHQPDRPPDAEWRPCGADGGAETAVRGGHGICRSCRCNKAKASPASGDDGDRRRQSAPAGRRRAVHKKSASPRSPFLRFPPAPTWLRQPPCP